MSSYEGIFEVLNGGRAKSWIGDRLDELTVDQQIAAANVMALAAIAEELNSIKHHGIAQSGQAPLLKRKQPESFTTDRTWDTPE